MNREIKFRAWDKEHKHMDYFDSHKSGVRYAYGEFSVSSGWNSYDEPTWKENVNDKHKVMQFTGLKDSKGKDIYEGDIVKTPGAQILPVEIDYHGLGDSKFWSIGLESCEIIGNVFENPSLIKG
jgi:uncharacterized phage protein (TIGR01671 family)